MENFTMIDSEGHSFLIPPIDFGEILDKANATTRLNKTVWEHDDKDFSLSTEQSFQCYPLFEKNRIVYIYWADQRFLHPDNLVVYNEVGSIMTVVSVPPFLSENNVNGGHADKSKPGAFVNFEGIERIDDRDFLLVNIIIDAWHVRFGDCQTIEVRALDTNTFQFHPSWYKAGFYW